MRSPRAWSYVTYLCLASALAGCPATPNASDTATDTATSTQTGTSTMTTGECPIGSVGCPCTNGGVCDPGLVCAQDKTCVDASGTTEPSTGTSTGTTDVTSSSTDPVSTTGPATPCDPADGQPNLDCMQIDPNQPYCADAGVCGGCTVLPVEGCAQLDPSKPICNPDNGKCVACTADDDDLCTGDTPACNTATNECEGCYEHSHCPETACDILKRECFPLDKVLYVRNGLAQDGECTEALLQGGTIDDPYCSANHAINHAQNKEGPTSGWTFKFLETNAAFYHGSVTAPSIDDNDVTEPVSYAFVHVGPGTQQDAASYYHSRFQAIEPVFTVGTNIVAYIHNFGLYSLNVQSDGGVGVACLPGSTVWLDDSYIRDARGPGVRSLGCDVYLRRSSIYKGKTEGIELNCEQEHCELHMFNSYISENLYFQGNGGGGIRAENATLDILYSTIIGNNNEVDPNDMTANGDAIHCVGDLVDGQIRNSVIARKQMGNLYSIKCDPAKLSVQNSLIDTDLFVAGNHKKDGESILGFFHENTITGARPINGKKVELDNPDNLDLLATLAVWLNGDPRADFDGEPRAAKDGESDWVGADVYIKP